MEEPHGIIIVGGGKATALALHRLTLATLGLKGVRVDWEELGVLISEVAVNNKTICCQFASRKGIASFVLEKSETLRADGGYIGVHVNGWRVLEQLGIAAELRETACLVTAFHDVWLQENKSNLVPVRKELQ
ncbi:hypothetical protein U9M48_023101 [Paspalum notatum var. saurae]|uniref:Uncharacterized protein n=1 Tax=Paspalum notatum var. saurae TaxID=547442 RepID=A0AAQ3TMF2_PASNO